MILTMKDPLREIMYMDNLVKKIKNVVMKKKEFESRDTSNLKVHVESSY